MAEAEMQRVAALAMERFSLIRLTAIHRFGRMEPGDQVVLVIATASHHQAAFDGANFVMDHLKTATPFWKKEYGADDQAGNWVEARDTDNSARDRWNNRTSSHDQRDVSSRKPA